MTTSLFSQSLSSLSLDEAIRTTAAIGYDAIELACFPPHFDVALARRSAAEVASRVHSTGLAVSALSLINCLTDPAQLQEQLEAAAVYIRLAPLFRTTIVKVTPGAPASAKADAAHWECLREGIAGLVPVARDVGVRLAFETHMRQLTDTLSGALRLLEMAPPDTVGLTVDFSNLSFAGENLATAIPALAGRTFHTHVKNGHIDAAGKWHFQALDQGLTDYTRVLPLMRAHGYDGYLSVECLGEDARTAPAATAARDLAILQRYLSGV